MNSTAPKTIRYSVIAPVYNEIEGLQEFYRVLHDVMEGLGEAWEVLLVDDGSTDGTRDLILTLADQDARVVPLIFTRNFGHQIT